MRALWIAPPTILIAGSLAAAAQLRRIATQRSSVAEAARQLEADRIGLIRLRLATENARASLERLEHR